MIATRRDETRRTTEPGCFSKCGEKVWVLPFLAPYPIFCRSFPNTSACIPRDNVTEVLGFNGKVPRYVADPVCGLLIRVPLSIGKRKGRRLRQRSAVLSFFALSLSGPLFVFFLIFFLFRPDAALRRLRNVRWLTGLTVGVLDYGHFFLGRAHVNRGRFWLARLRWRCSRWRDLRSDFLPGRESSENLGFSRGNTLRRAIGFNWSLFILSGSFVWL